MGEMLKKFVEQLATESHEPDPVTNPLQEALNNPLIAQVVNLLRTNPILANPTLQFIQRKMSEISAATLSTLYTPEQIEAMRKEAGIK